jgi:2-polyprenyl-3-methyl-5-hydroxy-6-metoxy-1,4-benzoquinol methylase
MQAQRPISAPMPARGGMLGQEEARRFWDRRHAAESLLRSGGDIGLTEADNVIFYQVRLGLVLSALAGRSPLPPQYRVLDAGCGKGWFSRQLADCGLTVHGIDTSPSAIEFAERSGGGPTYEVAALADVRPRRAFDAVICVDVLFHILDDDEWRESVLNLASVVQRGGRLVVADTTGVERKTLGSYMVHRPLTMYDELLIIRGFEHRETLAYHFRNNPLGLHVYERIR